MTFSETRPPCDYRWPLIDPNEEDRGNMAAHWCNRDPGHQDEHRCPCGEVVTR